MLCFAELPVLMLNDNMLVHTTVYCTAVGVYRYGIKQKGHIKNEQNEGSTLLYKMLEDMLALANSICLLLIALWSGVYARESTAKHCTARHRTAPHATARCCAAPLS